MPFHVVACRNTEDARVQVAEIVVAQVSTHPQSVLGLATGETMVGIYRQVVAESRRRAVDWSRVRPFNADDLVGSPAYRQFMVEHLFGPLGIPRGCFPEVPPGAKAQPGLPCEAYDEEIARAGGLDLLLLGLGTNGHIAFNEPGSSLRSRTRVIAMEPSSRAHEAKQLDGQGDDVPRMAVTMGIATILAARRIVVAAFGPAKASAVAAAVQGSPDPACPASALQLHGDATLVADREAAAEFR
ncbi:MAG TPA: glucosamine-6-phosphate deaminase [Bacillota bacterium]|nr:glucosamine-6-phosphate deaminase [Bacillota bacterium]